MVYHRSGQLLLEELEPPPGAEHTLPGGVHAKYAHLVSPCRPLRPRPLDPLDKISPARLPFPCAVRIAFDNLDMHSCCYCVSDDAGSDAGIDLTDPNTLADQAAPNLDVSVLVGGEECAAGQIRPVCPAEVLSCEIVHSRLETCLTFFNDYIMFADFVLHFFVGFKRLDYVTRMEVRAFSFSRCPAFAVISPSPRFSSVFLQFWAHIMRNPCGTGDDLGPEGDR